MKKTILAALLAASFLLPGLASAATYKIDQEGQHAFIEFRIQHLGYSWLYGRFNDFSGQFTYDADNPDDASVTVNIDPASIDTNHEARDKHLRGPDFLNVKEFPKLTFESTKIEKVGEREVEVTGDLTMHGQTHSVTLDGTFNKMTKHPLPDYNGILTAGFSGRGTIKRSRWGVSQYTPAIGDRMEILVEIEGFAQDQLDKLPE